MYILVTRWSGYETSVLEFATLEELKIYLKNNQERKEEYLVAKVLATSNGIIENIKE